MNYATIEEAWAKPKGVLNKFPISSVKHPLVAKCEMNGEQEEKEPKERESEDRDEFDIKTMTGLRTALRRLYEEQGTFGIDLVLPKGYVRASSSSAEFPSLEALDIEEIAKWMLMAAVVYIIFDLAK